MTAIHPITGTQPVATLTHRPRVLVVDDEPHWHDVWHEEIGSTCQLSSALSGREAIRMIQQTHPDLVILDRNMPGMSGDEVLAAIRALDTSGRMLIVMHSVRDDIAEQVATMSAGADIYVPKSTDMRIAAQTVRNLLTTQRSAFTAAVIRTIRRGSTSGSFADQLLAKGAMQFTSLITDGIPASTVDLHLVASTVISIFEDQLTSRGVQLDITLDEHALCQVWGDDQMLATALFHVIDFVSCRLSAGMTLELGILAGDEAHSLTLQSAIHLDPGDIERAFWWHTDEEVSGRDLALPLAWEIVAQHGGSLRLDHNEAHTSFLLTLPAYQPSAH